MPAVMSVAFLVLIAAPTAADTVRARVIAPFSTWAAYKGETNDGYSVSGAGLSFTIEHGAAVIEGGVRTDYFSSGGYGAAFDARGGGRIALIGEDGDGAIGLDLVGLVGVRHLHFTGDVDGMISNERALFATGAVALELSRRVPAQRFTGRLIASGLKALTDDVRAGGDTPTVFATDAGVEAGLELGVAF